MKILKWLTASLVTMTLAACGGGGDSGGSTFGGGSSGGALGGTTTSAATLTVALSSSTVTSSAPATVTATLQDSKGNGIASQVVTFASDGGLGTFSATTALTNSSGQASVAVYPKSSTAVGADSVTASASVNGTAVKATIGYQLTASDVTIASFTSDVGAGTLSAYGQATLSVTVANAAAGSPVNIAVSSACVTAGKATLSPTSTTTTSGTATFAYQDAGCGANVASDSLQATVTGGTGVSTPLTMKIASPAVSSVTFVSASPSTIYIKGSGFTETSTVTFKVVDIAGGAIPNQLVSMVATTYTGGLTLDGVSTAVTKTTDSNGEVKVLVNSGTIPTPVRVKASLVGSTITTSSSNLTITVGLPSQINFSFSQKTLNIEGFNIDGTPNSYTIIASDRMGNPVPAGTTINFVTEGGQIVGSKQIVIDSNGNATATTAFLSSTPRPKDGRITVVAYALGEESFIDANGNNVYDAGEDFQDLGDVFVSTPYFSTFDTANDQRIPYTLTGTTAACMNATATKLKLDVYTPSVATFSGGNRCDGVWGQAYVRRAVETVLSTSGARPLWNPTETTGTLSNGCAVVTLNDGDGTRSSKYYRVGAGSLFNLPATGSLSILVGDANTYSPEASPSGRLNPMAAGTTVSVVATTGITASVSGGTPVPSTTSVSSATITYSFDSVDTGTLTLKFTSPGGLITSVPVRITTSSSGTACTL